MFLKACSRRGTKSREEHGAPATSGGKHDRARQMNPSWAMENAHAPRTTRARRNPVRIFAHLIMDFSTTDFDGDSALVYDDELGIRDGSVLPDRGVRMSNPMTGVL
jgi:hypothetical protein